MNIGLQVIKVAILFGLVVIVDKLFASQEQQDQPSLEQLIMQLQEKEDQAAMVQEEQALQECEPTVIDTVAQESQEIITIDQPESAQ